MLSEMALKRLKGSCTLLLVGIDIGTTNIKGIVFKPDGTKVVSVSRPTRTHYLGTEIADYYPEEIWEDVKDILKELVSRCPYPEKIGALSLTILRRIPVLALLSWQVWGLEFTTVQPMRSRYCKVNLLCCNPIRKILKFTGKFTNSFIAISMKK